MTVYGIFLNSTCVYVGQTRNRLSKRISKYKSDAKNGYDNMLILRAMRKYGFDKFTFEPLATCFDYKAMDEVEIHLIAALNPRYNTSGGGNSKKITAESTRKKIADANRRRLPEQRGTTKVKCVTTGQIFKSVNAAAEFFNIKRRSISNNINGWNNTAHGLSFIKLTQAALI